jgi:prevent-host-death family protein
LRYSSEYHYIVKTTMNKAISAADANRRFSELLRTVKTGRSVVVTSHGKPVAKISPVIEDDRAAEGARSALFARLRRERAVNAGRWTRDELYDDAR